MHDTYIQLRGGAKALEAIERLALEVFNGLGDEAFQKVFGKAMPKHDFCDVIRREMTEFQTEKIPESYFAKDEQTVRALVTKASYWAKCYEEFDAVSDDLTSKIDVETYWRKIGSMVNEDGNPKYSYLSKFALTVMLLPHGNADAERGFSINKKLLEKHGNNLHEETIESLRIVKDFLIQSGGQNNIDISTEMIKACKSSRENYYKYLAEKREQEKQQEARLDEEVCKFHTLIFILLKMKKVLFQDI